MSTFKRIMSFVLAMVMVVGMLPANHVHAEETETTPTVEETTVTEAPVQETVAEATIAPEMEAETTVPTTEEPEVATEPTVPETEETVPTTEETISMTEETVQETISEEAAGAYDLDNPIFYDYKVGTIQSGTQSHIVPRIKIELTKPAIVVALLQCTSYSVWVQVNEGNEISDMLRIPAEAVYDVPDSDFDLSREYVYELQPGTYSIRMMENVNGTYPLVYSLQVTAYGEKKHVHSWSTRKVAPTCTSRGYTEEYCTGCSESSRYDYVDMVPHNEVYAERVEPTCTSTGKEAGTKCSSCGKTMSGREEIPKLPHDTNVEIPSVEPTCTTIGKTAGAKCSMCGTVTIASEDIPKLPHTEIDVVYVPATCTTTGLTAGTKCSVCNAVVQAQEVIPKLPHTEVNAPGVAATCTSDGKADVKICSVCQQEVAYTTIPKLGHDAVDYFCLRCGEADDAEVYAYGDCGDSIKWIGLKNGTLLIRGAGKMWDEPDIPTSSSYKKIVIEEGVTYIGSKAFDNSRAKSVSIPRTVTNIGSYSFSCSSLSGILTIPKGVNTISNHAFYQCSNITNVSFPNSLTWISPNAFYQCTSLTSINLPVNLRYIGEYAFYGCEMLDGRVTIPDLVDEIGDYTFYGCINLDSVSIGNNVSSIGKFAFSACRNITGVGIGARVNRIKQYAFAYCDKLKGIDLKNVYYVEANAFTNCQMNSVYLPKYINIGTNAFMGCGVQYVGYSGSQSERSYCVTIASGNNSLKNATWGYGYSQSSVKCPDGHTVRYEKAQAPTCTEPGWTEYGYCVNCNAVTQAKIELPALGHKYLTDTGVSPTCTEPGLTTGSHCGHCGLVETAQEEIPALGHTPKTDAGMAPSCELAGLTEGSHCEVCQAIITQQEVIPATGHNKVPMPDVPATCYEKGSVGGVHCSDCGRIFELPRKTPMLSHTPEDIPAVAPTCTEDGATAGSHCANCGEIYMAPQVVPALGHDMIADAEVPPTCTEPGTQAGAHCSRCDYTEGSSVIPALGHNEVVDAYKAPTCTKTGLTEGSHCDRCSEVFIEQEVIPAMGHDFVDGICQRCGAPDKADYDLFSGKSLTLKPINPDTGKAYTAKQLTWSMDAPYDAFATLKNGKVTAKVVLTKTRIEVMATRTDNGEIAASYTVDIFPAVTHLEVKNGKDIVNGKTILLDVSEESLTLKAEAFPIDTLEKITWTVSDAKKQVYATYTAEGDTLTINNPTGKAGTVTIKATVDAGVKKSVTVKVQFGSYANTVAIETPEKTTLRGGEKLTLTAAITEPTVVSKPGILWTTSNKAAATVSNGKVTAKNVAHPMLVTITATSKDGQAYDSVKLKIIPKNEGQLVLMHDGAYVTNSTVTLNAGETRQITASSIVDGDPAVESVTWSSSKAAVATVADGLITAVGSGSAKITAIASDGRKAVINVKVTTLVSDMTISTKDGKNLVTENGETIVEIASSKGATLAATVFPTGANKAVTWEITEGGAYAKISSSGKLTANKDLTSVKYVTVKATAKDGSGYAEIIRVRIRPLATGVQIYSQNNGRTTFSVRTPENWWVRSNTTLTVDLDDTKAMQLLSHVYPYYGEDNARNAIQGVTWKSSNAKIATIDQDGNVTFLKTGTVTITATANDGSGKKVTFKLKIV